MNGRFRKANASASICFDEKLFSIHSAALAAAAALSQTAAAGVLFDAPGHAAAEGDAVAASGGEPGAAWALFDWRNRDTGIEGVFDADGRAELPPLPAGYYRMVAGDAALATLAVVPAAEVRGSSFYGADCGISELWREFDCPWNGGDAARTVADLAALAGFTHVRERMQWSGMQRSPDSPPDVSRHAANAALFRDRGIGVSDIMIGTPKWAAPLRRLPGDFAALFRSCRDFALAFGDTVEDWEFWNEPDIHFAPEPVWDFAAAQKAAFLGFKAARPDMPVAMAGLCQPPDGMYLKTLLANGVAPYFDVFNYHTYAPISQYPAFFGGIRAALASAGAEGKPVWITESGTNLEGPAALPSVRRGFKAHSPSQELVLAEFAPKSQIAMQMEGAARDYFFILGAYSERDGEKDWGLLRRDGTVKPVYAALATIAHELGAAGIAGALDVGPGAKAFLFDQPDGSQTVAFWSESPIDTATAGHSVVEPEPDFARSLVLSPGASTQSRRSAENDGGNGLRASAPLREKSFKLVDLCGTVSEIEAGPDGKIMLPATRFPAYVSGLWGLRADISAQRRGDAESGGLESASPLLESKGEAVSRPPSGSGGLESASPIVFRVDLAPGDFDISNRKTLAIAKGAEPHLAVQAWNLSDTAATGTVSATGAVLEGLPVEPFVVEPFGCATFHCILKPGHSDNPSDSEAAATLAIAGVFDGREASPLSMPVLFEEVFLASSVEEELDWKNPEAWLRNDSAASYSVRWDEEEQALRFEVAWDDPRVGHWFYPVLPLRPRVEAAGGTRGEASTRLMPLSDAVRVAFEVKTAQDKVENDFGESCLMLVRGEKGGSPGEWLSYSPPTGSWERRYVELSAAPDLWEVDAIRLGANPRGMRLVFWVRGIKVLKPAEK